MNNLDLHKKFKDMTQHSLNVYLCHACGKGDMNTINYLLFSPELNKHAQPDYLKKGLSFACRNGHLNVVDYILNKQNIVAVDIHEKNDEPLYCAVSEGQLEVVKYLLHSFKLKEHANLKDHDYIIKAAFVNDHLNIVKYFFEELRESLTINDSELFRIAYKKNFDDIIKYLIFDTQIELTPNIKNELNDRNNSYSNKIKDMFNKRAEMELLKQELYHNKDKQKPFKL